MCVCPQGTEALPVGYREVRRLTIRVYLHATYTATSSLLGPLPDIAGASNPDGSARESKDTEGHAPDKGAVTQLVLPISVHDAYHAAPLRVSQDLRDLGVRLALDVYLRGKREAVLTVTDVNERQHTQRRAITGSVTPSEGGVVAFNAVGFLMSPFDVTVDAAVDGVPRRVTVSSGSCEQL